MTFAEAVTSGLIRFVRWEGRATRAEFWWFGLFNLVLGAICVLVDRFAGTPGLLTLLVGLALLLPDLSVLVRRLHDTGRGGGSLWILLVPVVGPVLVLLWALTAGHPGRNRFGPAPLGRRGTRGDERRSTPGSVHAGATGHLSSYVPRPRPRAESGGDADRVGGSNLPPFST